jgi:hypothetical protein
MRQPSRTTVAALLLAPCAAVAGAAAQPPTPQPSAAPAPAAQTEADAYTRYELLTPGSGRFRILYEVSATTPGATHYFNPIRPGSAASDERVTDQATGRPLRFDVVSGAVARTGGVRVGDTTTRYIRVTLARPVPPRGGERRVLIDKTYEDAATYRMEGADIVFERSLGIKRNAVVLPAGYELVACNYPSQVLQEADGRILVSFWNATPAAAPLVLRARPAPGLSGDPSSVAARLSERARQTREIVYFLQQPETHAFDLYHDYTESRPGTSTYLNVVRAGSTVSNPSALNLDTGEPLAWEVLKGEAITRAGLDGGGLSEVTPETEVVVFRFAAVQPGETVRLRMSETYTDSARYRLVGSDELVWERAFGRPANAVVLPAGWALTNSATPAVVSTLPDGRTRLDFVNPRPDQLETLITARRRPVRP